MGAHATRPCLHRPARVSQVSGGEPVCRRVRRRRRIHRAPLRPQRAPDVADVIARPADALNVFDFEEAAHRKVLPGHWAYMASGVDDDVTIRANREGYRHVQLRPRRLRDATKVDMRVDLFGTVYNSPIFLCPTGGEKSFHPDGEAAVARAAKARGTLQETRR